MGRCPFQDEFLDVLGRTKCWVGNGMVRLYLYGRFRVWGLDGWLRVVSIGDCRAVLGLEFDTRILVHNKPNYATD